MENVSNNSPAQKSLLQRGLGKSLTNIPGWLKNKYFIAFAVFAIVLLFLDKNDLFTQLDRKKELSVLQQSKTYYTAEIGKLEAVKHGLKNDLRLIEEYAREKHLMKKPNEELFLVPEKQNK